MFAIRTATVQDARALLSLYIKGFESTWIKEFSKPERAEEVIAWIGKHCEAGAIFVAVDDTGVIGFIHLAKEKGHIVLAVVRDGLESHGVGTALIKHLQDQHAALSTRPTTKAGKRLAAKCGFAFDKENKDGELNWIWRKP